MEARKRNVDSIKRRGYRVLPQDDGLSIRKRFSKLFSFERSRKTYCLYVGYYMCAICVLPEMRF